jgi:hypothetical protein
LGEEDVDGMDSTFMMRWDEAVAVGSGVARSCRVIQTLGPIRYRW